MKRGILFANFLKAESLELLDIASAKSSIIAEIKYSKYPKNTPTTADAGIAKMYLKAISACWYSENGISNCLEEYRKKKSNVATTPSNINGNSFIRTYGFELTV